MATADRGPRRHDIEMPTLGTVPVYAGVRIGRALDELTEDMSFYHGVRLNQIMEAVYEQGLRDGRREVFEEMDGLKKRPELAHRRVGRPRLGR